MTDDTGDTATVHTLDLEFGGLPENIAAYLIEGPEGPVLVETGPASTLEALLARLSEHGVSPGDVKHVLVTHIHLDHAGAAGWWARQGAQVYVHHVGAPHLIAPERLLASARRIYGDKMDTLWGETLPAPEAQVTALADGDVVAAAGLTITAIECQGHARHHHVFRLGDVAFTGDVAAVRLPGSRLISLTAPPPEFDPEAWHRTLERLQAEKLTTLYLSHFGPVHDAADHLAALHGVIDQSAEFVGRRFAAGMDRDAILDAYAAWNRERAAALEMTDADLERYEAANSQYMTVDGILRYWRKRAERS